MAKTTVKKDVDAILRGWAREGKKTSTQEAAQFLSKPSTQRRLRAAHNHLVSVINELPHGTEPRKRLESILDRLRRDF